MKQRAFERGLSLIELLVALAITAALMLPLVQMQATAASSTAIIRTQLDVEREADFALERIAARVRSTPPALLAPNATDSTSGVWFGGVTFLRVGEQLIERSNGVDSVLADSVSDFRIVAPAGNGTPLVRVSLTLAPAGAATTAMATVRMGSGL